MDHSDQGPTKGQATLRRAEGEAGPRLLTASWQESQGPRCNSGVVGLPGLEPGTSSLSGFSPRACFRRIASATCANDLPPETAGDRCEPLGSDGVWTKCGPGRVLGLGPGDRRRQGEAFREDLTLLEPDRYVQSMLMHWAGLPLPAAWLPPPSMTPGTASMPRS